MSKRAHLLQETSSPTSSLHLSPVVFSTLLRQPLGINIEALQEHLAWAKQKRKELANQHQVMAEHFRRVQMTLAQSEEEAWQEVGRRGSRGNSLGAAEDESCVRGIGGQTERAVG